MNTKSKNKSKSGSKKPYYEFTAKKILPGVKKPVWHETVKVFPNDNKPPKIVVYESSNKLRDRDLDYVKYLSGPKNNALVKD